MANLIRLKQLDQADLSGFFNDAFVNTGLASKTYVDRFSDQTVSGIKTFENGINLDNIDNLNLSGVDISIGDASVSITNSDLGTSSANLIVQGSGTFFKGIKIGDGGLNAVISIYDGPNDDYNKISWNDSNLVFNNYPSIRNQYLNYDFSNDPYSGTQTIAVDSKVVHNTTNETISGVKTFASRPTVNGTGFLLNGEAPNLALTVYTTGNQTISGVKTFSLQPILSGNPLITGDLSLYATTTNLASTGSTLANSINSLSGSSVLTYGNQNISGAKTFFNSGIFSLSGALPLFLANNPLSIVGSGNSYLQLNIQNRATGTTASSDLVITANNGTDSANFINLGINNVGYSDPTFNNTTGLDGYLIMDGGDLDIGTRTPGKIIEFHAGGTTENNVIARINQNGLAMVSGYVLNTVNAGVIAGTNAQGQGSLTSQVNIIITNPNNPGGVTLPTSPSGFSSRIMVRNTAANPVNVYPANGARIDASGINFSGAYLIQNAQKEFYSVGTGQWYSI
jgi:hypothetical protein